MTMSDEGGCELLLIIGLVSLCLLGQVPSNGDAFEPAS